MRRIKTQSKSVKPVNFSGVYASMKDPKKRKEEEFHTLSIYTYLAEVEYLIQGRRFIAPLIYQGENSMSKFKKRIALEKWDRPHIYPDEL